jgi:hypothetical protein
MGASTMKDRNRPGNVEVWVEVWDYGSDASFRGFVTGGVKDKALFVFFEPDVVDRDLKSGSVSLLCDRSSLKPLNSDDVVLHAAVVPSTNVSKQPSLPHGISP